MLVRGLYWSECYTGQNVILVRALRWTECYADQSVMLDHGQSVILHEVGIATIEQDHTTYQLPSRWQKGLKTNGNQASRDILKWPKLTSQAVNYLILECRPHESMVRISTNIPKLASICQPS